MIAVHTVSTQTYLPFLSLLSSLPAILPGIPPLALLPLFHVSTISC